MTLDGRTNGRIYDS